MAPDPKLRSARLPSQKQVIELLDGEFARAGYDVEDVVIDADARPPRITVVADSDDGLDLDAVAELSRSASELLDRIDPDPDRGARYVLEVTSPGVDRPLVTAKHYRRAQGRKVEVTLSDGTRLVGRLGESTDDTVRLVVPAGGRGGSAAGGRGGSAAGGRGGAGKYTVRELPLSGIAKAVVQVEFSPPDQRELELAGRSSKEGEA
ncbi:ribosome maturation factor RimP [Mycolicibacterium thermoresistibile]